MKVYVVYYDNGHAYEEHDISVSRIFLIEDSASKYVIDRNNNREFIPITKEEYYSQDLDDVSQSYEDWLKYEKSSWDYYNCGKYFYVETEVFE